MYIDTYINESDQNTLNKDITLVQSNVTAVLKDDTEMVNPTLILSGNVSQGFNYVYISEFNRYYFVKSRTYSQQRFYVALDVDVLMSFQSDIESLSVIANRSSDVFNTYQRDTELSTLNYNEIQTQKFPYGFGDPCFVLAVAGGTPQTP